MLVAPENLTRAQDDDFLVCRKLFKHTCIYIYMYIYICIYIQIYNYKYIQIYTSIYTYMYIQILHMYVYIYIYIYALETNESHGIQGALRLGAPKDKKSTPTCTLPSALHKFSSPRSGAAYVLQSTGLLCCSLHPKLLNPGMLGTSVENGR